MNINLNDQVTFLISVHGLKLLADQDKSLGLKRGHSAKCWRHDKATNCCEAPLWDVMRVFGPSLHMGATEMAIEGNHLTLSAPNKETINWVTDGSLPDSDRTCLVQNLYGEVGEGFRTGTTWRWANASAITGGKIKAWADLPEGVK